MPFSFIDIEEQKSQVIWFVFLFIIFFYFLTAWILLFVVENIPSTTLDVVRGIIFPPLSHTLIAFFVAFFAALIHWSFSTNNLIEKISEAIGAVNIDARDNYHQYLKNIVDEVSVAIGGRPIQAKVIPDVSMNAFALEDLNKNAVIGVTEGLLSRLNRSQIEAVVAHEAGHIISGDCLSTTVTCSLSEVYEEALSGIKRGFSGARSSYRSRGSPAIILIYVVLLFMKLMSNLLRYFISRQREYRADAVSVRLSRNPLALAEALKMISNNWRGQGVAGEKLESIFIMSPRESALDEREGIFADLFSTHPPIKNRINILLDMAHMDDKTLEENLKNFKRVSPVAKAEFKTEAQTKTEKKWFVFKDSQWTGPFLLDELNKIEGLRPDQWIKLDGEDSPVMPAYEDKDVKRIFSKSEEGLGVEQKPLCPHCKTLLTEINYEGAPILKCLYCEGVFIEQDMISRILIRNDKNFSEDIARLAEFMKPNLKTKKIQPANAWVIDCPKCGSQMARQYFVYSYPVEIDRCFHCAGIWFDKQELEVLQYMYENKDKFLNNLYF